MQDNRKTLACLATGGVLRHAASEGRTAEQEAPCSIKPRSFCTIMFMFIFTFFLPVSSPAVRTTESCENRLDLASTARLAEPNMLHALQQHLLSPRSSRVVSPGTAYGDSQWSDCGLHIDDILTNNVVYNGITKDLIENNYTWYGAVPGLDGAYQRNDTLFLTYEGTGLAL